MGAIQDLLDDIDAYPSKNVKIVITDFQEPDDVINVDEMCSFRVRVENNGHLDMLNLKLHIRGSEFTSVSADTIFGIPAPLTPSDSEISPARDVPAHSSVTFGRFFMRADAATPDEGTAKRDLFSVHISTYDASLHHILRDHSHHANDPLAVYNREIHPD
jgi:hypothetical protein